MPLHEYSPQHRKDSDEDKTKTSYNKYTNGKTVNIHKRQSNATDQHRSRVKEKYKRIDYVLVCPMM